MPYKDPEKAKEAKRKSKAKAAAKAKAEKEAEARAEAVKGHVDTTGDGLGDRPTVADAEAAYGNEDQTEALSRKVIRSYGKSRTWACIMYQDSAPADWEDRLRMIGVSFAVSPLHDKDVTQAGAPKKPHWHVILDWPGGSTTYQVAQGITRGVLKGTIPIPLVSPRGYFRYFTHLDNPNKAQYDRKDIITGNGFDIGDFLELTSQEKAEIRFKLLQFVTSADIVEYWDLITYAMYNEDAATLDYICSNTTFWTAALRSRRHMQAPQPGAGQG